MGYPPLAPEDRFTYRHYRTRPDSKRRELIEGFVVDCDRFFSDLE
jgi:hypothetical protein